MKRRAISLLVSCAALPAACDRAPAPEVGRAVAPTMIKEKPTIPEEPPEEPAEPQEPWVPQVVFDGSKSLVAPPAYHPDRDALLYPVASGGGYYGFSREGVTLVSDRGRAREVPTPEGRDASRLRFQAASSTHVLWFDPAAKELVLSHATGGGSSAWREVCGEPADATLTASKVYWKDGCGEGLVQRAGLSAPGEVESLPADVSERITELCADSEGVLGLMEKTNAGWDDDEEQAPESTLRPQGGALCQFARDGDLMMWPSVYSKKRVVSSPFGQMGRSIESQEAVLVPANRPDHAGPLEPRGVLMGWRTDIVNLQPTRIPYTYGDISSRSEAGREWVFSSWDIHPDYMLAAAMNEHEVTHEPGACEECGARRSPEPTTTPGYVIMSRHGEERRFETKSHPSGVRFASDRALTWVERGGVLERVEWENPPEEP